MKTIQQALIDEIHYPISVGFVENVMIKRGLNPEDKFDFDVSHSKEYMGAHADCLYSLIQAINFSEADKSIGSLSDKQITAIISLMNKIYEAIGEEPKDVELRPTVYIGG